jgi:hypothetical protein
MRIDFRPEARGTAAHREARRFLKGKCYIDGYEPKAVCFADTDEGIIGVLLTDESGRHRAIDGEALVHFLRGSVVLISTDGTRYGPGAETSSFECPPSGRRLYLLDETA